MKIESRAVAGVVFLMLGCSSMTAWGAGRYVLAFWRELGAYENQAPPAGSSGNHSAFIHVWDETGQPMAGKAILNAQGTVVAVTQPSGYEEYALPLGSGYTFRVRDGAHASDISPAFSTQRAPNWGHYSLELGFMFQADGTAPAPYDTNYDGTWNAQGDQPCAALSAPATRSLAYYSTRPADYCSDPYELGQWATFHGQTFTATGDRVIAVKVFLAAGFGVQNYWTVQVHDGGPGGPPIGPPRTSRLHLDQEYIQLLITWGVNDVQVVPGRTYFLKITRAGGLNAFRVNRNNYGPGSYYENSAPVPGSELMGLVVCASRAPAGPTGRLRGTVRDTAEQPAPGAEVLLPALQRYGVAAADGTFELPALPAGLHEMTVTRPGFFTATNTVSIVADSTATQDLTLVANPADTGGVLTNGIYILQPFEQPPAWSSSFETDWGCAADFAPMLGGVSGKALQVRRGGQGASSRVQVFDVRPNSSYQMAIRAKCAASVAQYWAECAFKLGRQTAQAFDADNGTWTSVQRFSDSGVNGNGNTWTTYRSTFTTGTNSSVSVGFKHGSIPGVGPLGYWDQLEIVSLALPAPEYAVAESASRILVGFAAAVSPAAAGDPRNFQLTYEGGSVPVLQATLRDARCVQLLTALQQPGVDHTLAIRNVVDLLQPAWVTGTNGQLLVRVPLPVVPREAVWSYEASGASLPVLWRWPSYSDSAWPRGAAALGCSADALPTPMLTTIEPNPARITTYFRHHFVLPAGTSDAPLRLHTLVDDGAVFWVNTRNVLQLGVTNSSPAASSLAARQVGVAQWEGPFILTHAGVAPGTNLVAVEVHQADPTDPDVVFAASLDALIAPSQMPSNRVDLELIRDGDGWLLRWPGDGLNLESATNVLGPWSRLPGVHGSTNVAPEAPTRFYRLRP